MANFDDQVMGLTGLTISGSSTAPSQSELSTFLNDGVVDVTNKVIMLRPQDIDNFLREGSEQTSNGFNPGSSKIISVVRENGTNNQWYPCKKSSMNLQYRVTDTESLHYASKYNPVYMISQNRNVHVYPEPSSDGNDTFKVLYVNYSPEESDGTALIHSSSGIKWFPDDKVYLVVLYASIKSLQSSLSDVNISTFSLSASAPVTPPDPSISYSAGSLTNDISVAQDSIAGAVDSITVGPTDAAGTTDVQAPTDAAGIDVSAGPTDAAGVSDADAPTNAVGDTSSAYTTPPITTGTILTAMDGVTGEETPLGTDADFDNFSQWFNVLGELIEDEEDSELAQVQMGKIQTFIQAFQAEVQSASAAMQATISDAQLATQASIANAANDVSTNNASIASQTQASVANAANDVSVKNASISSQTQASIANANADVSTNNASMQTLVQASIANAANDVNASISKMQNSTQAATTKMIQSTTASIQKMSLATNVSLQNAAKTLEASIQDYSQEIALFQGELGKYQAQIAAEIQTYQQEVTEKGTEYQWMNARLQDLKQEYNQAFAIMAPPQQQTQPERRARA